MTQKNDDSEASIWVKNVKNIIGLLIVAALIWVGASVQGSVTQIAVLSEQVRQLQIAVQEAKGNAADRYTSSSAINDFHSRDVQIQNNTTKIEALADRLRAIEIGGDKKR